ncbi:GPI ethanolamine phosphate transferase 3 subunit O [Nematocida sp. LUAm3]|nr:GPI ethanolamine phosphate transferase 3 subunit O [Nematocida sp. LUAm3]
MNIQELMEGVMILSAWGAGALLYANSLFLSQRPIKEINTEAEKGIFQKALVFVVDGLRADAIYECKRETKYHGNFSFLRSISSEDVYRSVSIADLPTGTAMRILSTFSGIPTTLLSAQRSFTQQSCSSDSFIGQMVRRKKQFIFYGDETWTYLFPEIKAYVGEAYHPYGLVALKKEEELMERALSSLKEKDVVILHLISTDSYGHIYGTDSEEVQSTLKMVNGFIERTIKEIDLSNTAVVLLSDHGVNDDGSHGGTSFYERAASLVVLGRGVNQKKEKEEEEAEKKRSVYQKYVSEVSQLHLRETPNITSQNDILPTLSALLGIPTPYNSSGSLIPEILPVDRYRSIHEQEIRRKKKALEMLGHAKERGSDKVDVEESDRLGSRIYEIFNSSSIVGMLLGLFVIGASLMPIFLSIPAFWSAPCISISLVCIFMVCHSVFSIIHEDVISLCMCAALGAYLLWRQAEGKSSLFLLCVSLVVGRFPLHEVDRFFWVSWIKKIPLRKDSLAVGAAVLLGVGIWGVRKWTVHSGSILCLWYVGLGACKFFFEGAFHKYKVLNILLALCPGGVPFLLYSPFSALFLLLVYRPLIKSVMLSGKGSSAAKGCFFFFLLKLMFFCTGHNHNLSTINWEAAFLFSTKSLPGVSGVMVLLDILLPCVYMLLEIGREHLDVLKGILFLQGSSVFLCCAINLWFLGNSLLWFIFAGRTIFEGFFFFSLAIAHVLMAGFGRAKGKEESLIGRWSKSSLNSLSAWKKA